MQDHNLCFLEQGRSCNKQCMAFSDPPLAQTPHTEKQPSSRCLLLLGVHVLIRKMVSAPNNFTTFPPGTGQ